MAEISFSSIIKKKIGGSPRGRKSPTTIMREVLQRELKLDLEYLKRRMSGPTSSGYLSSRSGEMRRNTFLEINETGKGNITARIVIGQGVPYTSLHVGVGGGSKTYYSHGKKFTIPEDWVRNKDGSWKSPFSPGQLGRMKNLFRKKGVPDILYYRMSGGEIRKAFKLSPKITIPQRIDIQEMMVNRKDMIANEMTKAFGGFDFSYVLMNIK